MSNTTRSKRDMQGKQQAGEEQLVLLDLKAHIFCTTDIPCINLASQKITHIFQLWAEKALNSKLRTFFRVYLNLL